MKVNQLSFSYGKKEILHDISFEIKKGSVTTVLGANGSGKSTLFQLMTKNLKPEKGSVSLEGIDIGKMRIREFARKAAIVHQHNRAEDDLTVRELVSYGRIPHRVPGHGKTDEDEKKISWALEVTGLLELADRPMGKLSGGQRQRAFLAMSLAQDTEYLFLDEPTTFLDIRYQEEILKLVRKLNQEYNITVIMVLHEMNQAIGYSDELIALSNGKIVAKGTPEEVMTAENLKTIYDIDARIIEKDGRRYVLL